MQAREFELSILLLSEFDQPDIEGVADQSGYLCHRSAKSLISKGQISTTFVSVKPI